MANKGIYTLICLLVCYSCQWAQQPVIELEAFASGFFKPVDISHAKDGRLFITQQNGIIRIVGENGQVFPDTFLNIVNRVNASGNERGLLGLAFHPDHAENGLFFVNYTGSGGATRVSRFSLLPGNPDKADPGSELILLTVSQPFSNHNGGKIAFGPDGYLYIGLGDGGSGGDPVNAGQTANTLLGKMLRIDVDNQATGLNYAIPPDNPFLTPGDGIPDEIWAFGLRNPWRFSFDRLTGDLWIGDVGQNQWEEINFQAGGTPGGANFGWRCYEGNAPFNTAGCGPLSNYVFPVFAYSHAASGGCSVTGGAVYRGCAYPALYGHYVFADYCNGQFWSIAPNGVGGWTVNTLSNLSNLQYTAFGENYLGELFVAAHGQGLIYRIKETGGPSFSLSSEVQHTECGAAEGAVALSWPAVNEPFSVSWDNQQQGSSLENLAPGVYCATLTGANGCQFVSCYEVEEIPLEAPEIAWNDSILSAPAGYAGYQWYLDETLIEGAVEPVYIPLQSGPYQVVVSNANGCEASSEILFVVIQSARENAPSPHWRVSPNPFRESLHIRIDTGNSQEGLFEIFSSDGRLMWKGPFAMQVIDASTWPAGPYRLRLTTRSGQWGQTLLKN